MNAFCKDICGNLGIELPISVEWRPTYSCNANCLYCGDPKPKFEPLDYSGIDKIVEKLLCISPKYLWIGGGEPTLLRQLPQILRNIKEHTNTFIAVNTNLTNVELLAESLPYIDNIITSLDTLDTAVGIKYRGIDPHIIFNNLKKLVEAKKKTRLNDLAFSVNSVIVRESLEGGGINELSDALEALDHNIGHSFYPVFPSSSPYSINNDVDSVKIFYAIISDLKLKSRNVIDIPASFTAERILPKAMKCFRRYFRLRLEPSGIFSPTCSMPLPSDAMCADPCNCAPFIDYVLFPKADTPVDIPLLKGRFTASEITQVTSFIKRYIDPSVNETLFHSLEKQI
jgi:pyruvate-formate lyase-activating enzyme